LAKFLRKCPDVHPELGGHDGERRPLVVLCCGTRHGLVGHLARHTPSDDAGSVEMVDHRGPVNAQLAGESVDRRTVAVPADEVDALDIGEPALHRV